MGIATLAFVCLATASAWAGRAIADQRAHVGELVWNDAAFERQHRRETCGPAALAAVCRHFGIPATEEEIARLAGTTGRGTSMLGLLEAARAEGLSADAWHIRPDELASAPRPCLLFFEEEEGHFAVLTAVRNDRFYLADPSLGLRVWTLARLRRHWSGDLLVLGPGERARR